MKIENSTQKELIHTLNVSIETSEVETRLKKELETLGKNIQLDGFRKGKVPLAILEKKFSSRALSEVLQKLPEEAVYFALGEAKIKPALQPQVDLGVYEDGKPLSVTIVVEALPQIQDVRVEGLAIERVTEALDEEQKTEFKKKIKSQLMRREKASPGAPLKKGDSVLLKCEILDAQGTVLGDYKSPLLEYPVGTEVFGKKFETDLNKLKVEEVFELSGVLPAGYKGSKDSQDVTIKGQLVSHDIFIEPTDEELMTYLALKDPKALDDFLTEKLVRVNEDKTNQYLKRQILDILSQTHDFLVPPGMVQLELKTIWNEFLEASKDPSSEEATLLKTRSQEDILSEYQDIAERRVRLGLLLAEVGNRQGIKITGDELAQGIYAYAGQFPGEEQKVLDFYRKNPNQTAHIQAQIYEGKVIAFILDKAHITDREAPVGTLDKLLADEEEAGGSSKEASKGKSLGKKETFPSKKEASLKDKSHAKAEGENTKTKKEG